MRKHAPLLLILFVAAVARFWAIDFCLPSTLCRPDEEAVAAISSYFFTRQFNPNFFDWPSLFMYEVAAALVPLFKAGLWMGWYRGERHFREMMVLDPAPVFMTARLLSATAGVASVWLLFRVTRRLASETTALIAALFLALAFLHVRDSHFGVTDVTATALVLASFLFTVRFSESGTRKDLLFAAALAGLATATKYNAAIAAVPLLWVAVIGARGVAGAVVARLRNAGLVAVTVVAAFIAGSPYCVIEFQQFQTAMQGVMAHLSQGHGVDLGRGWVVHLTSSLQYGLGEPLLAAGLAGLLLTIVINPRIGILVALFPVTYYLVIGSGYTVFARYILPVVPFLCLAAALAVDQVTQAISTALRRPAWRLAGAWGLALAIVAPSAWSIVQFDRLLAREDGRVLAEQWVKQRFPAGATIGQMGRGSTHLHFRDEAVGVPPRYRKIDVADGPSEPDVLVLATSLFDPKAPVSAHATALAARYVRMLTIDTHDPAATDAIYDWQDEFYLPLRGFTGIRRPGPSLAIYLRPDLAGATTVQKE